MDKIELRYPVILVHGLGIVDKPFFWGRIPEKMKNAGLNLFLGNTDSWGSIENNALFLKETVDTVLESENCKKVNIIAHSKGGLDSRYLISSLGYNDKVASLTTLSTPHHGSEIVDFIFDKKSIYNPTFRKIVNFVIRIYGDRSPDPYQIITELTTESMMKFNQNNPDKKEVYYSSYHSIIKDEFDDISYFISYNYLKKTAGENDGLVSLRSARWGSNFTFIPGTDTHGISHSEIIDLKRKIIAGVDIPDIYLEIVRKLAQKGF